MYKVNTHYESLKVTRDAPPEVIRAAYRSLSQKFHPDLNSGKVESVEAMKVINAAYDVLSDPARRRAHDAWIIAAELSAALAQPPHVFHAEEAAPVHPRLRPQFRQRRKVWGYGLGMALLALVALIKYMVAGPAADANSADAKPDAAQSNAALASTNFRRPFTAPNGAPWPPFAAYVTGFQVLKADGLSTIMIDNGEGDSDVFLKLVALEYEGAYPVRFLFIPAHGRFMLNNVSAGIYDIRYRDLETGGLSRSEFFTVQETTSNGRKEFSELKMNLSRIRDSRMQMYPLSEGEF
jgi:DnaJ domain